MDDLRDQRACWGRNEEGGVLDFHILHRPGHRVLLRCVSELAVGSSNKSYREDHKRPFYGDPGIIMDPLLK